ncbi:MAG: hypothetical protein GXP08_16420 [Gammaproteobacteria bacterium]|nr:hypothetical protein [Gammaproteobacteria bacterium]
MKTSGSNQPVLQKSAMATIHWHLALEEKMARPTGCEPVTFGFGADPIAC